MVSELTAETFQRDVLQSATPSLVDFWASWCGPCRMLAPVLEELSKEYTDRLHFAKLSVDDYPEIAQQHEVSGIPCLILFHNGQEVDRIVGFMPKAQLKEKIERILGKVGV